MTNIFIALFLVSTILIQSSHEIPAGWVDTTWHITSTSKAEYLWVHSSVRKRIIDTPEWQELKLPSGVSDIRDLAIGADSQLLLLTNEGLFESADPIDSWKLEARIPNGYDARKVMKAGAVVWIAGAKAGPIADLDTVPNALIDDRGNEVVAFVGSVGAGDSSWKEAHPGHLPGPAWELQGSQSTVAIETPYEALISYDSGISWHPVPSPKRNSDTTDIVPSAAWCANPQHCWVVFSNGSIIVSGADGKWRDVTSSGTGHIPFTKLVFTDQNIGVGQYGSQLWLTRDAGATWRRIIVKKQVIDFSVDSARVIHVLLEKSVIAVPL